MLALNIFITRGADFGWTSPISLTLLAVTVIGGGIFLKHCDSRKANGFIDTSLFKNKYSGATVSNFLLNGVATGALIVVNTYVQVDKRIQFFSIRIIIIRLFSCCIIDDSCWGKTITKTGSRKPMILACILVSIEYIFYDLNISCQMPFIPLLFLLVLPFME